MEWGSCERLCAQSLSDCSGAGMNSSLGEIQGVEGAVIWLEKSIALSLALVSPKGFIRVWPRQKNCV